MTEREFSDCLIAGPTASGKSALALRLAHETGGIVVNADSMQVYRDLAVITARPTPEDEAQAPHRLYGHVDAAETYSAGRWLGELAAIVASAKADGRPLILTGGTGLYFTLASRGIAAVPPIPEAVRADLRARFAAEGAGALHAELARHDPSSAERIAPADGSRTLRALEVILATGRPLRAWQQENGPPPIDAGAAAKVFLAPERDALRRRIDARFDAMLDAGALAEVKRLAMRRLDPSLPAMKAHGVPWLIRHLDGEIGLDAASAQAKADTTRYAKRQFTWFRNQLPDWQWEAPEQAYGRLVSAMRR